MMQESQFHAQLRRGENVHLDCFGKRYTDSVTYKQEAYTGLCGGRKQVPTITSIVTWHSKVCSMQSAIAHLQDRKLDLSLSLPPVHNNDPVFLRYAYNTSTGTLATFASSINAFGRCFEGLISQAIPGAFHAEVETNARYVVASISQWTHICSHLQLVKTAFACMICHSTVCTDAYMIASLSDWHQL